MRLAAAACLATLLSATAPAADPEAGAAVFARRCAVCHVIVRPDGEVLVQGGGAGPNQFAMIGRTAGTVPEYGGYSDALVAAGEAGLVWTEDELAAYLEDPRAYLRTRTGNGRARSRMVFRLRDADERANVAAYLATMR